MIECFLARSKSFYFLNRWRNNRVSGRDAILSDDYILYKNANQNYIDLCNKKKREYLEEVASKLVNVRNTSDW